MSQILLTSAGVNTVLFTTMETGVCVGGGRDSSVPTILKRWFASPQGIPVYVCIGNTSILSVSLLPFMLLTVIGRKYDSRGITRSSCSRCDLYCVQINSLNIHSRTMNI